MGVTITITAEGKSEATVLASLSEQRGAHPFSSEIELREIRVWRTGTYENWAGECTLRDRSAFVDDNIPF